MNFNFKLEPGKKREKREFVKKIEPVISVILPYYNKEHIKQTVISVLNQTFPYYELLIIDDGSKSKESTQLLKEIEEMDLRIKTFQKKKEGLSLALDYGIQKASKSSKYIYILEDGDLIDKTYFETAYFALETNKDAAWAYTNTAYFLGKKYLWDYHFDSEKMIKGNLLATSAMIRKDVLLDVNGYKLKEKGVFEEWQFWLKLIEKGYYPVHLSYCALWKRKNNSKNINENQENGLITIEDTDLLVNKVEAIEFPREKYNWDGIVTEIDGLLYPVQKKTKKRNIMMVIPWMVMGGADKFNLDFLRLIDKNKYSVTVITTQPTEYLWRQDFEKYADEVFDLSTFLDRKYWTFFINYIIKTRNVDLFFNTNSLFGYAILPYIKATHSNLPILDYIHMEEWYNRNGGYSRDSAVVASIIDKTLFCNKNSQRIFEEYFKVPKKKSKTVYIGVDPDVFDSTKYDKEKLLEKYGIEKGKINIGYICRITYQKRPFLLIEIIKETIKLSKNIQFLIGGDGKLLEEFKEKIQSENLEDYVKILGNMKVPQEFYAICDITLNCSIKEGLALTTYESLSMGVPVISSDVGGQKEMISEDVGIIIPLMQEENDILNYHYKEEEITAYKDAILKIIKDLDTYKENARKRIIQGFTLDKMIENMEKEIEDIIKNPSKEAEKNGLQLKENINITKEYINHFLLANQWEYSSLCNKYNLLCNKEIILYNKQDDETNKQVTKISKREKINAGILKMEQFSVRIHLYHEFIILLDFIRGIFHIIIFPFRFLLLEVKRIRNIFKKLIVGDKNEEM